MNYYKMAWQKFAEFTGRSRRSEYWYFVLFNMIAAIAAFAIDMVIGYPIFYFVYLLASFIPTLAVSVRRLHDIGKSGWYYLIGLIPLVGVILLIVWFATDSQPGDNKWGPNPKEIGSGGIEDHLVA